MRNRIILLSSLLFSLQLVAQQNAGIVAGPMLGYVEMRTARVWIEVSKQVDKLSLTYKKAGTSQPSKTITHKGKLGEDFNPVTFQLNSLDFNTSYQYEITATASQKSYKVTGQFKTTDLWQYRRNFPDVTFLTGSCAYFNDYPVDRRFNEIINPRTPAKPYGGDSSIFQTMAREKADFMLWLGDNWYYREVDFGSEWGLYNRASITKRLPVLQDLWKAMPHYAIWDDHDYGPNNADKNYQFRDAALDIFKKYWANPGYGSGGEGIYTKLSYSDVDLFLMDDRYFRDNDFIRDSINGKPNPGKRMWGPKQMEWLKNSLVSSYGRFKIIVTGSQTLNTLSNEDCLRHYPVEFDELMEFLQVQNISGVIFLTGDRHHSEVIRYDRPNNYPLYDITVSSFTAGISSPRGAEVTNPNRMPGTLIEEHNYGKVLVTGLPGERILNISFINKVGEKKGEWSISEKDLRAPRRTTNNP